MEWLIVVGQCLGDAVAGIVGRAVARPPRGSLDEMTRRYRGSRVLRAELVTWPGLDQEVAATVSFVFANKNGLSFRDAYGLELLKVLPAATAGLELVESGGATAIRADDGVGAPVDFWLEGSEQSDGLAALRAALAPTP